MISGKQRSYLKSLANGLEATLQIGKNGLSENFLKQADQTLERKELVKINILNNSLLEPNEIAGQVCQELGAEFVQAIGNKLVIYRESQDHKEINLP